MTVDEVLAQARALAEQDHLPALPALIDLYFRHVAADDIVALGAADLVGMVASHRRLAESRQHGECLIRVHTPAVDEQGWSVGHTVIEIVTDDMPFLVDSVTGALTLHDHAIHVVIHPQLFVRRASDGALLDVGGDPVDEAIPESWMHVEIDRVATIEELEEIERNLALVLADVRAAVNDWQPMRDHAVRIAEELAASPPISVDPGEVAEAEQFLRWIADDNLTILGYREYTLHGEGGDESLAIVPGSGLGILRDNQLPASRAFEHLPPASRRIARDPHVLVLTKANSRSTVHRPVHLDYIGVKSFDAEGRVIGERRFLGLYTSSAYTESVHEVPVLRRLASQVLERSGFAARSHSSRDLQQFIETYPRDELFQVTADELLAVALAVLHLQERRQTKLFLRRDAFERFMSCLVYLPRDRYTTSVRLQMADILREAFGGVSVDYTARVSESVLARLHFVVSVPPGAGIPVVDADELEHALVEASRNWEDDFADQLVQQLGEAEGIRLHHVYARALPEAYKEDVVPRAAVFDVVRLDRLRTAGEDLDLNFYEPATTDPNARRFKVFRVGPPIYLSDILPVLAHMGVNVDDQRPYEVEVDGESLWIYDFGLHLRVAHVPDPATVDVRFEDTFAAAWRGEVESDAFNALVISAGLDWRRASVLRAYSRYLRQANYPFGQDFIESVVTQHVGIARLLVDYFEARFDPEVQGDREAACDDIVARIMRELDDVPSLDHDRVIRSLLALMRASLRTNYFVAGPDGRHRPALAIKLNPTRLTDLPLPRPRFEVWVHSPRVEGVHLRFGPVARGGLRWSDRREDFRTEVLGLVKAQEVKNAVIVPVGAKGGFYPKQLADPSRDREAWMAEGTECYRFFVSSLLDITDNLVDGAVVPPSGVVRHDGDDSYLVVAADKGTASFSDVANAISAEHGFWLGDAFASGGSVGYDHKGMGITARGAWESVKHHFRDLGIDTQTQDFTVVGIGDMSGDVFGNGMLLSEHIRLVGAFDHRHVFIDPDPDAARSFAERRRLFDLPRSSWADYDESLISEGGGVFPRSAKSIAVTPQMRGLLGLAEDLDSITPPDLIRALLMAQVDLLWNGGIGTYVKASSERNVDVGDKSNDAIRINGVQLRCRVVGEGGNLGFTQLGRVEAAEIGVRLNTDAIDNSAGVDTSDHEVNIKILLDKVVRDGDLTLKQRNELLAEMTDEVADLVLADNIGQNIALGNARYGAPAMISVQRRFIDDLVARSLLVREIEAIPGDDLLAARQRHGGGLTSPELAVLLAYSKIWLTGELDRSGIADDAWCEGTLLGYFPVPLRERFAQQARSHPLRRQIIATAVCNRLVNCAGITFVFRAAEETGATPAEIVRAAMVTIDVFGLQEMWDRIESLDNVVATRVQSSLWFESRRLLDRATRWFLQTRGGSIDVAAEVARYRETVASLSPHVPDALLGEERTRLARRVDELVAAGVPSDLAIQSAALLDAFSLLDITEISLRTGVDGHEVMDLYFAISERFDVDLTLQRITALPRDDRWQVLARQALRSDLYAVVGGLTSRVIRSTSNGAAPQERLSQWEATQAEGLARARATLAEVSELADHDLATLSVVLRTLRNLAAQAGTTTAWG